ncbi:RNA polymerase III subunit [Cavenderia fasciculata]|uniref:DNA-directed RNA polymerase III subunit RPC3 n=1 Tax=Cavenderia fasciculata TaxID=261658 RepID=F4PPX6_CACFS|nr:RNA polymerase III subunit [Cavenderia fasciculata]EGG22439.1 RNA polymerase III subunit [Cavenderia fasciculata]|eukprot:XP_004360290.1 RNA polymerase III subunit [Cavenderia fasciculata]
MYRNTVAIDIVKEFWNVEEVSEVFKHLVNKGKSTIRGLTTALKTIPTNRIKQSLQVLLQHQLVDFEEYIIKDEDKNKKGPAEDQVSDAYYVANVNNAIHRLRIGKYINFIKERYDQECAVIIEELMDNGRLTMESVVKQSVSYYSQRAGSFDPEDLVRRFEDLFTQLVVDHFIMKVPKPRPISQNDEDGEATVKEKREKGGRVSSNSSTSSMSHLNDPFAIPSSILNRKQKKVDHNLIPNTSIAVEIDHDQEEPEDMDDDNSSKKKKSKSKKPVPTASKKAAKKRKKAGEEDEDDEFVVISESHKISTDDNMANSQPIKKTKGLSTVYNVINQVEQDQHDLLEEQKTYWKVNYDQFLLEFKLMACIDFVEHKLDGKSAALYESMLKLVKRSIKSSPDPNANISPKFIADEVFKDYNQMVDGMDQQMDNKHFENYLSLMAASRPAIITKQARSSTLETGIYNINISDVAKVVNQKMLESIIKQKYGDGGLRLFKLLMIKKFLDAKQIAEMAMIPLKECKVLLFKMMERGVVKLQEVPRSADHFAAKTFYLFFVNRDAVTEMTIDDIYKAIYNTRLRLKAEAQPHADLIKRLETVPDKEMSEDQSKIVTKVQKITEVLEITILNLDSDLLVLSHF